MSLWKRAAVKSDNREKRWILLSVKCKNSKTENTHQLLQYVGAELSVQGPGLRSGGELRKNPSGKVTDPDLALGVLQDGEDVFQQILVQQLWLQLLHLCYVVLKERQTITAMTATTVLCKIVDRSLIQPAN